MAPHTQEEVITEDWSRPYTREQAAFPAVGVVIFYNFMIILKIFIRVQLYFFCLAICKGRNKDLAYG